MARAYLYLNPITEDTRSVGQVMHTRAAAVYIVDLVE